MCRGVSGIITLLFAVQAVLLAYSFSGIVSSDSEHAKSVAFAAWQANFLRAKAELAADSAINRGLLASAALPIDSAVAKSLIDAALLRELYSNSLQNQGLCAGTAFGQKKIVPLTLASLGSATKAVAVRSGNLAVLEYFVPGTPDGLFPCAEARQGEAVSFFSVPLGYSYSVAVPLP